MKYSVLYEFPDPYHYDIIFACSHLKDKSYNKIVMYGYMYYNSMLHTNGLYFFNLKTNQMENNLLPIPEHGRGEFEICPQL